MTLQEERDFYKLYCKKFKMFAYIFAICSFFETIILYSMVMK